MDEWQKIKASEFIDFNPRESLLKNASAKKVAMEYLQPYTRDVSRYEIASYTGGTKFRNGDTIMARITPCLENGKTAQVDFLENGEIGFGSTEFTVMRAKTAISDADFVYYLAISPSFREIAIQSMVGSSGRQRVQQGVLDATELFVPPLPQQVEIGHTLRVLDNKIANNTKINHHLEQMAQAIFKSWFVDFEPFDGELPKGWIPTNMGMLTSLLTRGVAPKYADSSEQRVINQKCIRDHMIDLSLARTHTPKQVNEKWLQYGDVLINSTGEGTLGRTAPVWFSPCNLTVDSHVTIVRPAQKKLIYFIALWCITHEREIEALHTGSTGQTELPRERIKAMALPLPDSEALERFNAAIAPIASSLVSNQEESTRLAELRDALLPRLMSGELAIVDLDGAK